MSGKVKPAGISQAGAAQGARAGKPFPYRYSTTGLAPIQLVLSRLKGVRRTSRGWIALCPAHSDRSPSLSVREARDGRVLLYCFAGCPTEAVCAALGLSLADLFPDRRRLHSPVAWQRLQEIAARMREQEAEAAFEAWRTATIRGLGVLERACRRVIHEGPGNPGFVVACELEPRVGYLLDVLLNGPRELQMEFYQRDWTEEFKWLV
uniref:Zinc finger CHC2-type domain-containing protein n=1 Tax=Ammonifex degensii TaxID=42838 RepID=A0A7C2EJ04_9THEO